jgi:hypothetical protein
MIFVVRAFHSRRLQMVFLALLSAVAAALAFQLLGKAYRETGYDFTSYLLSAKALVNGQDPYATGSPFPYVYPLFLAFILVPLTAIPYGLANVLWFAIGLAALLSALYVWIGVTRDETKARLGPHLLVPATALLVLVVNVVQNNLVNGQANLLVLSLVVWSHYFTEQGRNLRAAALLAAAIAIKLTPAILLLHLLVRRRYRALLVSLGLTGLFLYLPCVLTGSAINGYYSRYAHWLRAALMSGPAAGPAHGGDVMYFSVAGFLHRVLPAGGQVGYAGLVGGALALAAVLVIDLRTRDTGAGSSVLALYLISTLLISPVSETHHLIMLLPGLALIWFKTLFDDDYRTAGTTAALAVFFGLFFGAKVASRNPFYFLSVLTLFATVARLALKRPELNRSYRG